MKHSNEAAWCDIGSRVSRSNIHQGNVPLASKAR